jgi:hypothetical protein
MCSTESRGSSSSLPTWVTELEALEESSPRTRRLSLRCVLPRHRRSRGLSFSLTFATIRTFVGRAAGDQEPPRRALVTLKNCSRCIAIHSDSLAHLKAIRWTQARGALLRPVCSVICQLCNSIDQIERKSPFPLQGSLRLSACSSSCIPLSSRANCLPLLDVSSSPRSTSNGEVKRRQ